MKYHQWTNWRSCCAPKDTIETQHPFLTQARCPCLFLLVKMGSAKIITVPSVQPPLHKHQVWVADPVHLVPASWLLCLDINSTFNLPAGEQHEGPNQAQDSYLCCPTPGIAHIPMKTSSRDIPTKPIGETAEWSISDWNSQIKSSPRASSALRVTFIWIGFASGNPVIPWEPDATSESDWTPSIQVFSKEETGQFTETSISIQGSDNPLRHPETPWSKHNRGTPNGKVLRRSPLTILQMTTPLGLWHHNKGSSLLPSENIREL